MSMKKKSTLVYPNIPSAIQPVLHGDGLPVPEPADNFVMYCDEEDGVSSNGEEHQPSVSRVADNFPSTDFSNHKITEGELIDLIMDFILPKRRQNFWHQGYNSGIYYTTPLLHIKLGLKKNFVKALDVKGPAFTYLHGKFPKLTFEKVKQVCLLVIKSDNILKNSNLKQC
jgi:hypothetical protein